MGGRSSVEVTHCVSDATRNVKVLNSRLCEIVRILRHFGIDEVATATQAIALRRLGWLRCAGPAHVWCAATLQRTADRNSDSPTGETYTSRREPTADTP